jgi:multiple sugar transport system substrate-binding protein
MRKQVIALAAALVLAPLGTRAADLVVWWEKGFYAQEDEAVAEIIAAFKQGTGREVDVAFFSQPELPGKIVAALEAGQPPDFAFGTQMSYYVSKWAFDNRLVDLTDTVGHFSDLFDPDAVAWWVLFNRKTGQRALYALPMGRTTNHIHLWKSLLEQAGFTLDDIPKEWDAFWSFWCDQVQPAVRRVTGREDIWGVGLNMSGEAPDTQIQFFQFLSSYDAHYMAQDGRLIADDPRVQRRLIEAIDAYTAVYRKGCTPPSSIDWDSNLDNNKQFHAQAVVIVLNDTLSIPNALKRERSEDYYRNTATIEWPLGPDGEAFPIFGNVWGAVVFKGGRHVDAAKELVRFLVAEGWLAHYLEFAGERFMPPMQKLREGPLWLDPSDPHRMAAVMQIATRPTQYEYIGVSGDWRYDLVWQELVWAKAIHRVAAEGISPEQAVDDAIARIKQILAE